MKEIIDRYNLDQDQKQNNTYKIVLGGIIYSKTEKIRYIISNENNTLEKVINMFRKKANGGNNLKPWDIIWNILKCINHTIVIFCNIKWYKLDAFLDDTDKEKYETRVL